MFFREWWAQNGHSQVKVPTPLAWLRGPYVGEGSHTPTPFSSFWVCNYFVFLATANKVCLYWKVVCVFF